MNLIFKNPTIKTDYEYFKKTQGLSMEETSRLWTKNKFSEERIAFSILIGYLDSICEIADECENQYESHPAIDLTYKTVKHLPLVLGHQYFSYVKTGSYTSEKALEIANKTLAAYFMLLCMNEHMCFPTISQLDNINEIMDTAKALKKNPDDSWMGVTIKVGTKEEIDFIKEVGTAVKVTSKGAFRIRVSHIAEVYKRICGVNLYEYGIEDYELADE